MLRVRIVLAFVGMIALVVGSESLYGQPVPARVGLSPTPLASLVLSGVDDKNIIDELKLSEDQVKTLVARRTELWDENYVTAPTKLAEGAKEHNKALVAFLQKTLTEAQYKRAVQIGAQTALGRGFGGSAFAPDGTEFPVALSLSRVTSTTLNRYPELIDAFKLTETQKTALESPAPKGSGGKGGFPGNRGFAIATSPEQITAVTEFVGPMFTKTWRQKFDPRLSKAPTEPQELSLLSSDDVRAALKVTGEQMKAATALQEKWTELSINRRTDLSPKEADALGKLLAMETEKTLAGLLKPEQSTRLKQIAFQTTKGLHIEQCYQDADVAKGLGLSEKQVKELDEILDTYKKSVAKVLEAAESFVVADKQVKDLTATRRTKSEAVLNTDQTTKLKELIGEQFTGNTFPDSFRGSMPRIAPTLRLFITANPTFSEALKLTSEQLKTIAIAREAYQKAIQLGLPNGPFGGPGGGGPGGGPGLTAEMIAARNTAVENLQKAVDAVLTPEQTKRVPQLVIQSAAATSLINALTAVEMARTLELTPDQTAKLIALGEDAVKLQQLHVQEIQNDPEQKLALHLRDAADERMMAVLTAAQKAKWKALTGEPWVGLRKSIPSRFGGGPGGGGGRPGGGGFGGPFDP